MNIFLAPSQLSLDKVSLKETTNAKPNANIFDNDGMNLSFVDMLFNEKAGLGISGKLGAEHLNMAAPSNEHNFAQVQDEPTTKTAQLYNDSEFKQNQPDAGSSELENENNRNIAPEKSEKPLSQEDVPDKPKMKDIDNSSKNNNPEDNDSNKETETSAKKIDDDTGKIQVEEQNNDKVSHTDDKSADLENKKEEGNVNAKELPSNKDGDVKYPELIAKLEKIIVALEGGEDKNLKTDALNELKVLLTEGMSKNSDLAAKLEKIVAGLNGIKGKNGATDLINKLRQLVSADVKGENLMTNLEKAIAALKGNEMKAEISSELKEAGSNDADKSKALAAKLEETLSILNGNSSKDVKANALKELKTLIAKDDGGKGANQKTISKLRDLLSKEGADNEKQELASLLEKTITELKGKENEPIIAKKTDNKAAANSIKDVLGKLEDHVNEKTAKGDNVNEKPQTANKELKDVTVTKSTINKEIKDSSAKLKAEHAVENETGAENKLSGDGNNTDSLTSKFGQKVSQTHTNDAKGGLADHNKQDQNKNNHSQKGNGDNGKLTKTESGSIAANDKTQTSSKAQKAENTGKPAQPRDINSTQIKEMVVQSAKKFIKGGSSEIHLNIKKPNMGNIKISFIESATGKLELLVMAERPEAAELIKQNSADLKQALLQQGIDLSKFDVFDQFNENRQAFAQENVYKRNFRGRRGSGTGKNDDTNENAIQTDESNKATTDSIANNEQVNVLI